MHVFGVWGILRDGRLKECAGFGSCGAHAHCQAIVPLGGLCCVEATIIVCVCAPVRVHEACVCPGLALSR